jgi:hypothetical protein
MGLRALPPGRPLVKWTIPGKGNRIMCQENGGRQWLAVAAAALWVVLIGVSVQSARGYPRYRQNENGGYCVECHGHFIDDTSPQGTQFPGQGKMGMHMNTMGTDCFLCHDVLGEVPDLDVSAGTADNPGVGCNGCHGRDYGGNLGHSAVGLRRHHYMNNVTNCLDCGHASDPMPLPENVMPLYYGTPDTLVTDPCNLPGLFGENFSADLDNHRGQDNDGDNLYDEDDPDCGGCPWDCGEVKDSEINVVDFLALATSAWGIRASASTSSWS